MAGFARVIEQTDENQLVCACSKRVRVFFLEFLTTKKNTDMEELLIEFDVKATPITLDITTASGRLHGAISAVPGVLAFKGIPYAAPPVGPLRWQPPQPVQAWPNAREATTFGATAWAAHLPGPPVAIPPSEDCLTINVWTAARTSADKLPVMVWIHGGGFEFGSSADPVNDGALLAAKKVIVVSFNYRLGVFGFLAHNDLDKEGSVSGNFGVQDQLAALNWVRANIVQFGGDPDNVTLFGQSAGAHSVGLLMTSPLAKGLFHRAIGQSGAFWDSEHGSISTAAEARIRGHALATRLADGSISKLRELPAEQLQRETEWNFSLDPGSTAFTPSIDQYVLPGDPADSFAKGHQMNVPLLAGWNGDEGAIYTSRALPQTNTDAFRAASVSQFGEQDGTELLTIYSVKSDADVKNAARTLVGDLVISEQTWEWLQLHQRTGTSPVYGYQFNYHSPYCPLPVHTSEMSFVFGTLRPQMLAPTVRPAERDRELAEQMMTYWVNFARTGNPNGAGLPGWPTYNADKPEVMQFAQTTEAAAEIGTERFRFLRQFRAEGRFPESWRNG